MPITLLIFFIFLERVKVSFASLRLGFVFFWCLLSYMYIAIELAANCPETYPSSYPLAAN